jgi:hypothetical protein
MANTESSSKRLAEDSNPLHKSSVLKLVLESAGPGHMGSSSMVFALNGELSTKVLERLPWKAVTFLMK